jgi:D-glycero-D-manno-heptose 1,7-bisphosphate phosphatase
MHLIQGNPTGEKLRFKIGARAVFLDRDGVINSYFYHPEFGTVDSPANPEQFNLVPGVAEAMAQFKQMGFLIMVVSNQPGVAKGKFSSALLDDMTRKMEDAVRVGGGTIDAVYYCLHHPEAPSAQYRSICDCRKPAPGLLLQAAREWDIDLQRSYTVGDGVVDILAGKSVGTTTVFVSPRKCYLCDELSRRGAVPDYMAEDLLSVAQLIRNLEAEKQTITTPPCAGIGEAR